jgi:hypothetical protein
MNEALGGYGNRQRPPAPVGLRHFSAQLIETRQAASVDPGLRLGANFTFANNCLSANGAAQPGDCRAEKKQSPKQRDECERAYVSS